mmetsp:Transcript_97995/g.238427  ORF Transcript_97995/g.238427 Transcript_97995/m.238427 type:complete len:280 (-) Transcript_97995:442-1281(-)
MAERSAAAWHNALVNGGFRGVDCVLKPELLVLQLSLGCSAHLDQGDATNQLGQALLQLLLGVVALRLLDLGTDLSAPLLQGILGCVRHDCRRVLLDDDAACHAKVLGLDALQLPAKIVGDVGGPGDEGDVLQERLPVVSEAGRLDGAAVHDAPELVHDQCCQDLLLNGVRHDEQGPVHLLRDGEDRDELLLRHRDLLVRDEHHGVGGLPLPEFRVGGVEAQIGGHVALVQAHALCELDLCVGRLRLLQGDHSAASDLHHGVRDHLAGLLVAARRNSCNL